MTRRGHTTLAVVCLIALPQLLPLPARACELLLQAHRSGQALARLPLNPAEPEVRIAFEHSVLGTTVTDRYRFAPQAWLVEEVFEGQGYGLPHTAGSGEHLRREGERWHLTLQRLVEPLVVRPLPAQHMRLQLAGQSWPLAQWGSQAIQITSEGCVPSMLPPTPPPGPSPEPLPRP